MKLRRPFFCLRFHNKGLAFGLWLVWLCGIFLIGVSFYATQMSFSIKDQFKKPKLFGNRFTESVDPTVTIFTAPGAFVGSVGERQDLALRSWLGLSSSINVVLFSQDSSAVSFAAVYGSRVSVEPNIDFTFLGNPFFHSMIARAQASASDISVLIDPEMVLYPDFFSTLKYADKLDHDWLLVASSPNTSHFPFLWDADGRHRLSHDGKKIKNEKGFQAQKFPLQYCDRRLLMAWNNEDVPLHNGVVPPFLYGKGIHNHWVITEALSSDYRNQLHWPNSLSLPHSFEQLLSLRADQNRTVVLVVAGYSYKDMLMSWVCRLRHLQISNFLVCAIDHEIYEFSVLQGLPVFAYEDAPTNISFDNCHFGTECFQKVTKVKSRLVLQILKLGYNVLMSDVDVYWFKNPLPLLRSFGPAILVAQSDEYNITGPINLPRRLNSGFYYANSDSKTISALQKVVEHASASTLSEQPSFYDTLCGERGSHRVGDDRCLERETNLTVHFLDRDLFPNGAYKDLWQERSVKEKCRKMGCYILHNNWLTGKSKKLERQVLSGLWEYDMSTRMCLQNWHRMRLTSYF